MGKHKTPTQRRTKKCICLNERLRIRKHSKILGCKLEERNSQQKGTSCYLTKLKKGQLDNIF